MLELFIFIVYFFTVVPLTSCVFFPVGPSSLTRNFQQRPVETTKPVENFALTTKGLQERKHNIGWDDGGKRGIKIN